MAKNRQNSPKDEMPTIQYLISETGGRGGMGGGSFVIEIPADWRVTFSGVNPSAPGSYHDGYAMRVYEGEKLRAVYAGVRSFRDLSIPLARKVQTETGSAQWTRDDAGNLEEHKQLQVATEYRPDDDTLEF